MTGRPQQAPDFDVLVIGSGPAGQRAAIQAAKLGRRVGLVEREPSLGGVSANTGTAPSKTLRAAIVDLTGFMQKSIYGDAYRVKQDITIDDLLWRTRHVIEHEREVVHEQLRRNHVHVIPGEASFADPHTLRVDQADGAPHVTADRIVVSVGTRPLRPDGVDFDDRTVIDSDGILTLAKLPATMTVVGAGVVGAEYASMFAALGVHVTVVDRRPGMLDFVDREIVEALTYHLRGLSVTFRFGEAVSGVRRRTDGSVVTELASGKRIPSDIVLYAAGRQGATDGLNLEAAGLEADDRGRVSVDAEFRTSQAHIFAAGDVIGFPSLTSTSMEQGRLAALAAVGAPLSPFPQLLPFGIYTLPEISFVGSTERELTDASVPYVVGLARYREVTRGEIAGDPYGLVKLLVHPETRAVLGVHILGTAAAEIVHVGQAVMAAGLTVDYLVDAVFNYPTFADALRVAALDAANRVTELVAA